MAEHFASVSEYELCEKCIIKQLSIRFSYDIMNYQNLVSVPSASADNTDLGFDNS